MWIREWAAAFLTIAGCSQSAPHGEADGAVDATVVDGDASDATGSVVDGGASAAMAGCLGGSAPPDWARTEGEPHRWRVECPTHAVSVWALAGGVLRVRYLPADEEPVDRSFSLVEPASSIPGAPVLATSVDGALALCTDEFVVRVARSCELLVTDAEGRVLLDDLEASATRVVRSTPEGEPFFGLGEKTGGLDRRGRRLIFWNTDAYDPSLGGYGPDQDPLYLSVPFFVAIRDGAAYGLFTDVAHRLEMDLAASSPTRYAIGTAGPLLDQYLVAGPRVPHVVRRFTELTGRTPLPPQWALGYHQSRWGYAPSARVEEVARGFRDRDIPADAIWLDIQHMDGYRTFTFDPVGFPDPDGLAARLEELGFRLVVIADPGLAVAPGWEVYDRAVAEGLVLRREDGSAYEGPAWPGASVFLDHTLPEARAFWAEHVGSLMDRGVDGIWLDVNEPTVLPESGGLAEFPTDLPIDGDGAPSTMAEGHNVYALHQARATYEGMLARAPERRPFILSRAGFAGIQRYAAIWTGDAPTSWESLRQTPAMLMSLGLSGVPFVGSDIGGYSGHATPELFARWMAVGASSPFCRGHVTNGVPDQEPWAFGVEVEAISRHRLRERYRLLPYLYSLFAEASETGAPPLRPMVWEWQGEPSLWRVDDQMMLGPWLLVAPVLEPDMTQRAVRLPPGQFMELDSGALYEGPGTIEVSVTLGALPTFLREGAILPRADGDALRVDVFPGAEVSRFTMYEDAGDGFGAAARRTFELARTESGARLVIAPREGTFVPPARDVAVHVRPVDGEVHGVRVDGVGLTRRANAEELASGGFWVDSRDRSVVVRFADRDGATVELDYDATVTELRPDVEVVLSVRVPAETPIDPPVAIASSADGWLEHRPLAWVSPGLARGTIRVPRGEWFYYKYTRGSWDTVEKWEGCEEAANRYGFGAAHPIRSDLVAMWRDACP